MADLATVDKVNINGNNYDRTQTVIEISGIGIATTDMTTLVTSISYQETPDIQFGYSLGSRRPTSVGFGNIESDGSITFTDAGVSKLQEVAVAGGLPSILYLGQTGQIDITISYTTYNGGVKTDVLEHVYFTNNNNGVNTGDVLNERELSLVIGRIETGAIL